MSTYKKFAERSCSAQYKKVPKRLIEDHCTRSIPARLISAAVAPLKKRLSEILSINERKLARLEEQVVVNQRLLKMMLAESREMRLTIKTCHDKLRVLMDDRTALDAHREAVTEAMNQLAVFTELVTNRVDEHDRQILAHAKRFQ